MLSKKKPTGSVSWIYSGYIGGNNDGNRQCKAQISASNKRNSVCKSYANIINFNQTAIKLRSFLSCFFYCAIRSQSLSLFWHRFFLTTTYNHPKWNRKQWPEMYASSEHSHFSLWTSCHTVRFFFPNKLSHNSPKYAPPSISLPIFLPAKRFLGWHDPVWMSNARAESVRDRHNMSL